MAGTDLIVPVSEVMREVAHTTILPGYGTAAAMEKSPGDLVTEADRASEAELTRRLPELLPGSRVVGEEAAHADPGILTGLGSGVVWVVDPLDGTNNYAAGSGPFAMMVALVRDDHCVSGWILDPLADVLWVAESGAGSWQGGRQVIVHPRQPRPAADLTGHASVSGLGDTAAARIAERGDRFASLTPGPRCAGAEYPAVIAGDLDFCVFGRTQPWDHLPGVLFAEEAGGRARRPDGAHYRASDCARPGLLLARDHHTFDEVQGVLFPGPVRQCGG